MSTVRRIRRPDGTLDWEFPVGSVPAFDVLRSEAAQLRQLEVLRNRRGDFANARIAGVKAKAKEDELERLIASEAELRAERVRASQALGAGKQLAVDAAAKKSRAGQKLAAKNRAKATREAVDAAWHELTPAQRGASAVGLIAARLELSNPTVLAHLQDLGHKRKRGFST